MSANQPQKQESEFYSPYAEFAKTLRTWFVACGIGGPVVLLSSDTAWSTLVESGCGDHIGLLFLMGGALQVLGALINKHAMWNLYFEECLRTSQMVGDTNQADKHKESWRYRYSLKYSLQNWTDEMLDIFTVIIFGFAMYIAFIVLSNPKGAFICNKSTQNTDMILIVASMFLIGVCMFFLSKKSS